MPVLPGSPDTAEPTTAEEDDGEDEGDEMNLSGGDASSLEAASSDEDAVPVVCLPAAMSSPGPGDGRQTLRAAKRQVPSMVTAALRRAWRRRGRWCSRARPCGSPAAGAAP